MGDDLRKVHVGEALAIPAGAYNAFVNAARAEQSRQGDQGAAGQVAPRESGIILVKNTTESDLARFAVLGIDAPVFTPDEAEQEFKNRVALVGITPDVDEHCGRFAVLLEPLAAGRIGLGMVQGVTPVRLRTYTDHSRSADVQDGVTGYLCDQIAGAAKILWREEGISENEEDLKWAVIAFRGGGAAGASYVWRAQVTGVYAASGGAWASYVANGWQAYVTAHPLYQNGTPDEETTLLLKLTADCAEGEAGFKDVAVGDRVGYIIATDTSDVLGQPAGTKYDGWVILHGGDDGATLAALQHAAGGPGIDVDEVADPFKPKVKVDLADPAGLEFVGEGDAGKLRALPDRDRGLDLDGAGIFIDLADENPGLVFEAAPSGDLKVLPDPLKGIVVGAQGVGVKLADATGLQFTDPGGEVTLVRHDDSLAVTDNEIHVRLSDTGGLEVEAEHGLSVKLGTKGGLQITENELELAMGGMTETGLYVTDGNEPSQTYPECELPPPEGEGLKWENPSGLTTIHADRFGRVWCAF